MINLSKQQMILRCHGTACIYGKGYLLAHHVRCIAAVRAQPFQPRCWFTDVWYGRVSPLCQVVTQQKKRTAKLNLKQLPCTKISSNTLSAKECVACLHSRRHHKRETNFRIQMLPYCGNVVSKNFTTPLLPVCTEISLAAEQGILSAGVSGC